MPFSLGFAIKGRREMAHSWKGSEINRRVIFFKGVKTVHLFIMRKNPLERREPMISEK